MGKAATNLGKNQGTSSLRIDLITYLLSSFWGPGLSKEQARHQTVPEPSLQMGQIIRGYHFAARNWRHWTIWCWLAKVVQVDTTRGLIWPSRMATLEESENGSARLGRVEEGIKARSCYLVVKLVLVGCACDEEKGQSDLIVRLERRSAGRATFGSQHVWRWQSRFTQACTWPRLNASAASEKVCVLLSTWLNLTNIAVGKGSRGLVWDTRRTSTVQASRKSRVIYYYIAPLQ